VSDEEIDKILVRMQEIVAADLPFHKVKMFPQECIEHYEANGQVEKVNLVRSTSRLLYSAYILDGQVDTFYGPLVASTGCLKIFDLVSFSKGFCLQYPMDGCSGKVLPRMKQVKLAKALKEHSDWCAIMRVKGVGSLNEAVKSGKIVELINLSEALHERKYADIADKIYARRDNVKIVFIAGPSSSGKTSTSKRLAIQCRILGLNPKVIELDNYFVERSLTPRDENGEYDFEALGAMDLELLGTQLNQLLNGVARHTATPYHCLLWIDKEADGEHLHAVLLYGLYEVATVHGCGDRATALGVKHLRYGWTMYIGVQQTDLIAHFRQSDSQVSGDSGFAYATLTRVNSYHLRSAQVLHGVGFGCHVLFDELGVDMHGSILIHVGMNSRFRCFDYGFAEGVVVFLEYQGERYFQARDTNVVFEHTALYEVLTCAWVANVL
jgi:hypothetical protein